MRLLSQVAMVTGGGSGISKAVALRFAQEGAAVVVADAEDSGLETVLEIRAGGGTARFAKLDVSLPNEVKATVEQAIEEFGGLHILFNGAGILTYGTAIETSDSEWERIMAVNLTGTFFCCREALRHMVAARRGAIINVASTTGSQDACARAAAYVSSKGGVVLLTRSMAIDFAKYGIRVNALCPGPTDTRMLRTAMTTIELESFAKSIPMQRLGQPEEVAAAALFLASEEASFVTGVALHVDGGQTAEI